MATVTAVIGESPLEGSSVSIQYNDQTLIASGLIFTCGPNATSPLTWWYETTGGTFRTGIVPIATAVANHSFPAVTKGVLGLLPGNKNSNQIIVWPFKFIGFGHSTVVTPPAAT